MLFLYEGRDLLGSRLYSYIFFPFFNQCLLRPYVDEKCMNDLLQSVQNVNIGQSSRFINRNSENVDL